MQIGFHRAFHRSVGHPNFPPSCATILAALESGPATSKTLQDCTGLHRNTIRQNLSKLESAGLAMTQVLMREPTA